MLLKTIDILPTDRHLTLTHDTDFRNVVEGLSQNKWRYLLSNTTLLTTKRLSRDKHGN